MQYFPQEDPSLPEAPPLWLSLIHIWGNYELDLVLRNNITTEEHPFGVYHPHAKLHHIKKENIGLIEVMGLAVLPSRLDGEMADLEKAILDGADTVSYTHLFRKFFHKGDSKSLINAL